MSRSGAKRVHGWFGLQIISQVTDRQDMSTASPASERKSLLKYFIQSLSSPSLRKNSSSNVQTHNSKLHV
jgi:hypothetical protein